VAQAFRPDCLTLIALCSLLSLWHLFSALPPSRRHKERPHPGPSLWEDRHSSVVLSGVLFTWRGSRYRHFLDQVFSVKWRLGISRVAWCKARFNTGSVAMIGGSAVSNPGKLKPENAGIAALALAAWCGLDVHTRHVEWPVHTWRLIQLHNLFPQYLHLASLIWGPSPATARPPHQAIVGGAIIPLSSALLPTCPTSAATHPFILPAVCYRLHCL